VLHGVLGRPFLDVASLLDLSSAELDAINDEVCLGLANVPTDYTGGSHRSMQIMPESRRGEAHADYGEIIASLDAGGYETFRSLADDPETFPPRPVGATFGEERDHPLSRRQMLWLERRHGVYFPWKVYFEMIPNRYWDEKSSRAGKDFTRLAKTFFPRTIDFVTRLPFREIGRCNVMGLDANDHGTVHRDGIPEEKPEVDHFITFVPGANKRLFLWDEDARTKTPVLARAYWFNDSDYHGVEADPFFRYSIRVDGIFSDDFLRRVRELAKP
jgi:hypothetical protein